MLIINIDNKRSLSKASAIAITIINIFINYYSILFDDRNFLFEFELFIDFDYENKIFVHVVNILIIFIQIKNVIARFIMLFRHNGTIHENILRLIVYSMKVKGNIYLERPTKIINNKTE